eukprot:scaffold76600_cov44-Phaeocystis_antarctica.AAC.2
MASAIEALGMAVPYSSSIPAWYATEEPNHAAPALHARCMHIARALLAHAHRKDSLLNGGVANPDPES